MSKPLRIAAIVTTFFPNSHAGVLASKFLHGFPTDEGPIAPRTRLASLYIDQIHERDIGLQLAHQFDLPVYSSIRAALTLGGSELAVDAVLLIGEHGDYPRTVLGQEMLPRRYFFEQICGVIAEAGRPIPIFNDKHLAYRWDDARWMYETARQLDIPLWAGSALPLCWRSPNWEHPLDRPIDEALAIGFHMIERYGFHSLESLQCQVERRAGGETGVATVQCLSGEAVWRAGDQGRWSRQLAHAALVAAGEDPGQFNKKSIEDPHLFLIDYIDGLRAAILMLGEQVRHFAYAARSGSTIDSLEYITDSGPSHAAFSYLGLNIEDFFLSGVAPTPIERTYLTTGILEAAMRSRGEGGQPLETPHLAIAYAPAQRPPQRPQNTAPNRAALTPPPALEPGSSPPAAVLPISRDGTVHGSG